MEWLIDKLITYGWALFLLVVFVPYLFSRDPIGRDPNETDWRGFPTRNSPEAWDLDADQPPRR